MSGADFPSMGATLFFGLTAATLITYKPGPIDYINPLVTHVGTGFVLGPDQVAAAEPIAARPAAPYLRPVLDTVFAEPEFRVEPMARLEAAASPQTAGIADPDRFESTLIAPERSATQSIDPARFDPLQGMEADLNAAPEAPQRFAALGPLDAAGTAPEATPFGRPNDVAAAMIAPNLSATRAIAPARYDPLQGMRADAGEGPDGPGQARDISRPGAIGARPDADPLGLPESVTAALISPERSATQSIDADQMDPLQATRAELGPTPAAPRRAPLLSRPGRAGAAPDATPLGRPEQVSATGIAPDLSATRSIADARLDPLQRLRADLAPVPTAPPLAPDLARMAAAGVAPIADVALTRAPDAGGNANVATPPLAPDVTGARLMPGRLQPFAQVPRGLGTNLENPGAADPAIAAMRANQPSIVNGDGVHLRRRPTTEAESLAQFDRGTPLMLLERREDWALVVVDGVTAWMFGRFVVPPR